VIILDTHVLLWIDRDDPALGPSTRARIEGSWRSGEEVGVSAISFWECAMLAQRQKIVLPCPAERWRTEILGAGMVEVPLDGRIALLATTFDDLHRDPADRFIAATAMHRGATLFTADEKLLAWRSDLVRHDARE